MDKNKEPKVAGGSSQDLVQTIGAMDQSDEDLKEILENEDTPKIAKSVRYTQLLEMNYPSTSKQRSQKSSPSQSPKTTRSPSIGTSKRDRRGSQLGQPEHKIYAPYGVRSDVVEEWKEQTKEKEMGKYGEQKLPFRETKHKKPKVGNLSSALTKQPTGKKIRSGNRTITFKTHSTQNADTLLNTENPSEYNEYDRSTSDSSNQEDHECFGKQQTSNTSLAEGSYKRKSQEDLSTSKTYESELRYDSLTNSREGRENLTDSDTALRNSSGSSVHMTDDASKQESDGRGTSRPVRPYLHHSERDEAESVRCEGQPTQRLTDRRESTFSQRSRRFSTLNKERESLHGSRRSSTIQKPRKSSIFQQFFTKRASVHLPSETHHLKRLSFAGRDIRELNETTSKRHNEQSLELRNYPKSNIVQPEETEMNRSVARHKNYQTTTTEKIDENQRKQLKDSHVNHTEKAPKQQSSDTFIEIKQNIIPNQSDNQKIVSNYSNLSNNQDEQGKVDTKMTTPKRTLTVPQESKDKNHDFNKDRVVHERRSTNNKDVGYTDEDNQNIAMKRKINSKGKDSLNKETRVEDIKTSKDFDDNLHFKHNKHSDFDAKTDLQENSVNENRRKRVDKARVKCKACLQDIRSNQLAEVTLDDGPHVICQRCERKMITNKSIENLKCEPCERGVQSDRDVLVSDSQSTHGDRDKSDGKRNKRVKDATPESSVKFTIMSRKQMVYNSKESNLKDMNGSKHRGRHLPKPPVCDEQSNKIAIDNIICNEQRKQPNRNRHEYVETEDTSSRKCQNRQYWRENTSRYEGNQPESTTGQKILEHHKALLKVGASDVTNGKSELDSDDIDMTEQKQTHVRHHHDRRNKSKTRKRESFEGQKIMFHQHRGKEEDESHQCSSDYSSRISGNSSNVKWRDSNESDTLRENYGKRLTKITVEGGKHHHKHNEQSALDLPPVQRKERRDLKKTSRSDLKTLHSSNSISFIRSKSVLWASKSRIAFNPIESLKRLNLGSKKLEVKTVTIDVEPPTSSSSLPYEVRQFVNIKLERKSKEVPLEIVVKFKKAREKPQIQTKGVGTNTLFIRKVPHPIPHSPPSTPQQPSRPTSPLPSPPPTPKLLPRPVKVFEQPRLEESHSISDISFNISEIFLKKGDSLEDKLMKQLDKPKGLLDQINLLDFKEEDYPVKKAVSPDAVTPPRERQIFGGNDLERIPTTAVLQPVDPDRSNQEIRAPYKTSSDVRVVTEGSPFDDGNKASVMVQTSLETRQAASQTETNVSDFERSPSSSTTALGTYSTIRTSFLSPTALSNASLDLKETSTWKQKFGNVFKGKTPLKRRTQGELVDIIHPAEQGQSRDLAGLRFVDEQPRLAEESTPSTAKSKYTPQLYSGGVEPKDIGYNLHGSFYQPPTSWNKKVLFPPPDDTLEPTDQKVRVSERKPAIDFLYSIGYTREQAAEALVDDMVHKLLHAAIREAHIWVNVIPKEQGMLLLLLANKCKDNIDVHRRYFHQLAEAIVNCRITRAMQLEGYIEVLNEYIKGNIPREVLLDEKCEESTEDIDPEIDLKKKTQELFRTVYMYTKKEAGGRRITKDSNEVKLLRALVANYSTYLQPHLKLLAQYIANQKIVNLKQLKAAIEYLQVYKSDDINITHFEEFCL